MNAKTKSKKMLIVSSDWQFMEELAPDSKELDTAIEYAKNGNDGIEVASSFLPEIVLVGDDMTDMSPVELARRIRNAVPRESTPIIVVGVSSSRALPSSKQRDNSTKGDNSVEMMKRQNGTKSVNGDSDQNVPRASDQPQGSIVKQVVEAIQAGQQIPVTKCDSLECHDVKLDRNKHRVSVDDRSIRLTPTEFKLLWELASRPGYVLSRQELSRLCKKTTGAIQARTIDAHIKSIRRKLAKRSRLIETVHGIGYRFLDVDVVSGN